jgi:hypothetical protein
MALVTFLFILVDPTFAQRSHSGDDDILKSILEYEIGNGQFYIQCEKPKTYFDPAEFVSQNGTGVRAKILTQLRDKSLRSSDGMWETSLFDSENIKPFLIEEHCLTKEDCGRLFDSTGKRQRIICVSDPVFDNHEQHCVVSITHLSFKGSASGHSYFLKKVYGRWLIVFVYDDWAT